MRFYQTQHQFYCGIDLHTTNMYLCVIDAEGAVKLHRNIKTKPDVFLKAIQPFQRDVVVGAECVFTWYWLADLCQDNNIPFVLGHALYMKAIHGGKAKNDRIDSEKIARLLRGGNMPIAFVYPKETRSTRDLLRRRMHVMRQRAELLGHLQLTNYQYNLPRPERKLSYKANRDGFAERFDDESARMNVQLDLELIQQYDRLIAKSELYLTRHAKVDDPLTFQLLRSITGVGQVLSLVLMYEIHDIRRFPSVGDFLSYARLVRPKHESNGKSYGGGGRKIGNAHLKWAFSEAVCLMLRESDQAKRFVSRKERKHGKARAMSMLARKLGRAVYYILLRKKPFDVNHFFAS